MRKMGVVFVVLIFMNNMSVSAPLKGIVKYEGKPIVEQVQVTTDSAVCGKTLEKHRLDRAGNGGVVSAIVWVEGVKGKPVTSLTIDQKDCRFVPYISAIHKGGTITITSTDPVLHNAHGFWMDTNSTAFNVAVPIPGMSTSVKVEKTGIIKIRCDAGHTWMEAYVRVFESEPFSITNEKGEFLLEAPPGKVILHAWHPLIGEVTKEVDTSRGPIEITFQTK